jgi:hypothetical protein
LSIMKTMTILGRTINVENADSPEGSSSVSKCDI